MKTVKNILNLAFQLGTWPASIALMKIAENAAIAKGQGSWEYPFVIGLITMFSIWQIADTVTKIPKVREFFFKVNNMGRRKK